MSLTGISYRTAAKAGEPPTSSHSETIEFLEGQRHVLEMIAISRPLDEILTALLRLIEAQSPDMLCSILTVDPDGIHMRNAAAPSLPDTYNQAINGIVIGPNTGSCGTAAYRREAVFVEDIERDPLWLDYRDVALRHGLRACWSKPIFDSKCRVQGTLATYHRSVMLPDATHKTLIDLAVHVAAIAINRQNEENALRRSEARLAAAQAQAKIGSFEVDAVTQRASWSAELFRLFGRNPKDGAMMIAEFNEYVHPDDRADLNRFYERAMTSGDVRSTEFRTNPERGRMMHIAVTAQSVKDAGGKVVHMSGTAQDITDRHEAEVALQLSESGYRLLRDSNIAGVVITTINGVIKECNDAFLTMLGYTREDLAAGRVRSDLITPPDWLWINHCIREELNEFGVCQIREKEYLRKDGTRIPALVRAAKFPHRPDHLVAFVVDITERKTAENALSENEERFRALFESSPNANLVHVDGTIKWVNRAMCKLLGAKSPGQLVGKSVLSMLHPDFHDAVRERWNELNITATVPPLEEKFVRIDGSFVDVEVNAVRVKFRGRNEVQVIARDITERKRDEAALEAERQFSNTIIDSLPGVFYLLTPQRRLLRWNKNFERVVGKSAEELAAIDTMYLFPPEERALIRERVESVVRDGEASVEASFLTHDGSAVPYYFTGLRLQIGRTPCVAGVGIDVSERKRAAAALVDSERRLVEAQSIGGIGDWRYELTTGEIIWSNVLYRLFERDPAKGPPEFDENMAYYFPEDGKRLRELVKRSIETGEDFECDLHIRLPSGREVYHYGIGRTEKDAAGKVVALHGIAQDITERKRAEAMMKASEEQLRGLVARLQRAQEEERTRMAREIHDELGQLLTGLKMDVRWIERKLSELDGARALNPILDRVVAASELTDTTIAAVQRIASELRPNALDQLGLAAALTQRARRFHERTGIVCSVHVAESGLPLPANVASEMFSICQEALTNVARHSKAAKVEIRLRTDEKNAMLDIRDDGCGIAEAALKAPNSLGLLGMRERALACGGTISIQPCEPSGTLVRVLIPRDTEKN